MGSPTNPEARHGSAAHTGFGLRVLRRLSARSRVLLAVALTGATWLVWDGGLGWSASFALVAGLSLTVAVVAGMAVVTGLARVAHFVATRSRRDVDLDRHNTRNLEISPPSPESNSADNSRPSASVRQHT